jgi:serine protease Do
MNSVKSFLKKGIFRYPALAVVAAAFLVTGMLVASSSGLTGTVKATTPMAGTPHLSPPSFADLVDGLGPAVVNIRVTKIQKAEFPEGPFGDTFQRFFGDAPRSPRNFKTQGAGSGVIINTDGTILTNNHVVEGAQEITVTMNDKREYKAHVVGRDPKTDLAVIKMDAKGAIKAATLGDSEALRVGEWVLAIGNPFGLSNTVTSGIVSAKGRVIGAGPYDDFIHTDAPINPGNSGGPLFNMRGEVIGINTAIIPNGQGIGFAVPVNTAKTLLPQLVGKGTVTRGYLGVNIQNMTDDLASSLNLKSAKGALVSDVVQGAPADKAGVKRGDVIAAYNGKEIGDSHELSSLVAATSVDKEVPLRVVRDGKDMTLQVRIGKLVSHETEARKEEQVSQGKWGLLLQELTPELANRIGLKGRQGVVVAGVQPGSPADEGSIQSGDIILEVNRQPVKSVEDVKEKMEKSGSKSSLLLLVQRGGNTVYVALKG